MSKISPDTTLMRKNLQPEQLADLNRSITEHGLICPITVKPEGSKFIIIAGNRRFKVAQDLGWEKIACVVRSDTKVSTVGITYDENFVRADIPIIDEASFIDTIMKDNDLSQTGVAKLLRRTKAYVSERLAILNYPAELLAALEANEITFSVAREFSRCSDVMQVIEWIKFAKDGGCSALTARQWVHYWKNDSVPEPIPTEQPPAEEQRDFVPAAPQMNTCDICETEHDPGVSTHLILCPDCVETEDSNNEEEETPNTIGDLAKDVKKELEAANASASLANDLLNKPG